MKLSKLFLVSLALSPVVFSTARAATVYTNGVATGHAALFADYSISASVSSGAVPDQGCVLEFNIDSNLLLTSVDGTIGVGHNWYAVTEGQAVSPDLVASGSLLGGLIGGAQFGRTLQLQPGQSFLIGFWLDSGGLLNPPLAERGDSLPGAGDRFGWARLSYTSAGGLILLESATLAADSTTNGILAGTTTTVPETSVMTIAAVAGGFALRRRR